MKSHPKPTSAGGEHRADSSSERCLLYLLGELNAVAAERFEYELSQSDALQAELLTQSSLLVGLSSTEPIAVASPASQSAWQKILITIASIAACGLIAFLSWPSPDSHRQKIVDRAPDSMMPPESLLPESLLIAQAWADQSLTVAISDITERTDHFVDSFPVDSIAADQGIDDEASLSWMVSAVEAGVASDG